MPKIKKYLMKGMTIGLGTLLTITYPGISLAHDGGERGGGGHGGRDGGSSPQTFVSTVTKQNQNDEEDNRGPSQNTISDLSQSRVEDQGDDEENENENENQNQANNVAPTVAIPAAANPNPVNGTSTALSVLGADDNGEANLIYTWSIGSKPANAPNPLFSSNGTNGAKNTTATFGAAGTYQFLVTISDNGSTSATGTLHQDRHGRNRGSDGRHRGRGRGRGDDRDDDDAIAGNGLPLSVTSSVSVTVNQIPTAITVSPTPVTVLTSHNQQFVATSTDQFGIGLPTTALVWSVKSGGVGGTINASGLYTAPSTTGSDIVQATAGSLTGAANVSVVSGGANQIPTITVAANANPSPVLGTTTTLSALATDDGGEANLTYTWSVTGKPAGATDPTFSVNGTNASKSTVATFSKAGTYQFTVTATDTGSLSASSNVIVTVNQTPVSLPVIPASTTVFTSGAQQFTTTSTDQFGNSANPVVTWSVVSGGVGGTINSSGLYIAPTSTGSDTIHAVAGTVTGTAHVNVEDGVNVGPTIAIGASAALSPVTGTTTTLSVLGADDRGENLLHYLWSVVSKPIGASDPTFSINGTNSAKNTVATFSQAGIYIFQVTATDAGSLSATSSVLVNVNQTPTIIFVSPTSTSIASSTTQQFSASSTDQFGAPITSPTFTWSVIAGGAGGSISGTGLYTASTSPGADTINVSSGTVNTTAHITIF